MTVGSNSHGQQANNSSIKIRALLIRRLDVRIAVRQKRQRCPVEDDVTFRLPALTAGNRIPCRLSQKETVRYYAAIVSRPKDLLVKRESFLDPKLQQRLQWVWGVHACWPLLFWWTRGESNP